MSACSSKTLEKAFKTAVLEMLYISTLPISAQKSPIYQHFHATGLSFKSQTLGQDAITACYGAVQNSAELDPGTSPKAWRSSNSKELAKQLPYSSLQPPCWGRHKQGEERAKSTACFIPAHPQPSQQALAATGSRDQRQQPGCYKLQRGTSPATRFIAQDQGSTATASTLFSVSLCWLLGPGERSGPPCRS